MKKKKIYNYIDNRVLLSPLPERPGDPVKRDREMYGLGHVKVPRRMLMDERWQSLKPTSKSVYLWLMAKEEIIKKKRKALIDDNETAQKDGVITASYEEIAVYTGIRSDKIKACKDELYAAGLVESKQVLDGKKIIATIWKIAHWPIDKRGYVKMPLAVMISPAWQSITHSTKNLYLVLLSEHCSARKKMKQTFPVFELAYSQIQAYGLSIDTIRSGIKALEDANLIVCEHGEWNKTKSLGSSNEYTISTAFLYNDTNATSETRSENTGDTTEKKDDVAA